MHEDLIAARAREYERAYEELLALADRLDVLRHLQEGVEPRAGAALHAVRFAASILRATDPDTPVPGFRQDTGRLLALAANWREAVFEIGEFALPDTEPAEPPAVAPPLRLVTDPSTPS
ncbi:hypothetical protein OG730_40940 [Streptomyces sp. NBC_01298]|uniref:hypothetical protein n=1 Tax=Streptomyces sp. NBC_01298 TaxID=2903817 RepID=UPI002E14825F|nr:hypothetical protein OG730_40940 [Streptomyces sp. NBC_01298]